MSIIDILKDSPLDTIESGLNCTMDSGESSLGLVMPIYS